MALYDSIVVPCPKCGERAEFQSKSGPIDVHHDVRWRLVELVDCENARHSPYTCGGCGTLYQVEWSIMTTKRAARRQWFADLPE